MNRNCEFNQERIMAAAYGELPEEEGLLLRQHMESCEVCQREQEELEAMQAFAEAYPMTEPSANLVARSRMRLEEAMENLLPQRWYSRLGQNLLNNLISLKGAPVAACALLLLGVGAGSFGGYKIARGHETATVAADMATNKPASTVAPVPPPAAEVTNISSIVHVPDSNMVEVSYNEVTPQKVRGSMDDPQIRQLLMLATANSSSPGVRDNSVKLLADACRSGKGCSANGVQDALMVALRYDHNVGVREKALMGLEPYVAEDVRVRNAVLESLMNDPDARIRNAAINILEPVQADMSVRQVLHSVAYSDQSPEIRTVSRQVLSKVPEIQ